MTNNIDDFGNAGCIFAIGTNTAEAHPVLALRMKKALRRGATLTLTAEELLAHELIKPGRQVIYYRFYGQIQLKIYPEINL